MLPGAKVQYGDTALPRAEVWYDGAWVVLKSGMVVPGGGGLWGRDCTDLRLLTAPGTPGNSMSICAETRRTDMGNDGTRDRRDSQQRGSRDGWSDNVKGRGERRGGRCCID
eukprot:1526183-Rhodomonas_salina.2